MTKPNDTCPWCGTPAFSYGIPGSICECETKGCRNYKEDKIYVDIPKEELEHLKSYAETWKTDKHEFHFDAGRCVCFDFNLTTDEMKIVSKATIDPHEADTFEIRNQSYVFAGNKWVKMSEKVKFMHEGKRVFEFRDFNANLNFDYHKLRKEWHVPALEKRFYVDLDKFCVRKRNA